MKLTFLIAVGVIGVSAAGCSHNQAATVENSARASVSLFDRLRVEVGAKGAVAIVPTRDGIVAVSHDGARQQMLTSQRARRVVVDNRSRVLWLQTITGKRSELRFLDLTEENPKPEIAVTDLPEKELIAIGYTIDNGEYAKVMEPYAAEYDGCVGFILDSIEPIIQFQEGQYDIIFEEQGQQHRESANRAKIVEAALPHLRDIARRKPKGELLLEVPSSGKATTVASIDPNDCYASELCGKAEDIPGFRLQRVIVRHTCGDACHVEWQLYDPDTKEFFDFKTQQTSPKPFEDDIDNGFIDVFVSKNGEGFIRSGNIYLNTGAKVFAGDGEGGGWLGGQYYFGID